LAGCEAAKAGRRLTASPIARPLWVKNTNGRYEEYAVSVMGVVGWWWRLLNEAEAHGRHDFISAAKPASARDASDRSA
jgi:hypothetical protein